MTSFLPAVLAILVVLLTTGCDAFTIGGGGGVMVSRRGLMEMRAVGKRGKVPSPPRLRHDYSHRADERDWNSDTFEEHREGTDGVPALNLFVRGKHAHSEWMPAGNVVPDDATVHLINYYRDTGSDTARKELDDIIAKSLAGAWEANTVIDETIFSVYPHLRKKQSELEFGYKISHENLSKEQQTIHVLPLGSRLQP